MKAPLWKTLDRALRKKMAPAQKKKKKKKENLNVWLARKELN